MKIVNNLFRDCFEAIKRGTKVKINHKPSTNLFPVSHSPTAPSDRQWSSLLPSIYPHTLDSRKDRGAFWLLIQVMNLILANSQHIPGMSLTWAATPLSRSSSALKPARSDSCATRFRLRLRSSSNVCANYETILKNSSKLLMPEINFDPRSATSTN